MKKSIISTLFILLILPIAVAAQQAETINTADAGTLPSSRVLWALDKAFDGIQHRFNSAEIAKERLAELKAEIEAGRPEAADQARKAYEDRRLRLKEDRRQALDASTKELEKKYNEKFDFDLATIKDKVNSYLTLKGLVLNENVKVNLIGNRRLSFEAIVADGKIVEIRKLDAESSPDAAVTLSHGQVYSAMKSDSAFNALALRVGAGQGVRKATTEIITRAAVAAGVDNSRGKNI